MPNSCDDPRSRQPLSEWTTHTPWIELKRPARAHLAAVLEGSRAGPVGDAVVLLSLFDLPAAALPDDAARADTGVGARVPEYLSRETAALLEVRRNRRWLASDAPLIGQPENHQNATFLTPALCTPSRPPRPTRRTWNKSPISAAWQGRIRVRRFRLSGCAQARGSR